ncbi:MAG: 30S ribosomal protein S16 [Armatimonadetes bacterium]|nr:MAG: 30S ribosomal protein S16 [Armatimonadota bacterium]MCE7900133.1 30S ribosomal protein S16 [Armatimonadetes bacterium ATM1]MDL1929477.1 30S ribosomal protein S16 [Fimbriimonadia bacterium ATM]MBC6969004.1 30S ribosomal protein S16 [Armatimonadota bacterium]MBL1148930.1 30S ribosomal protein S16 [Armatimonadota bacterium]
MNKIRLKRMGAKKRPYYRIVVAPSLSSRDGSVVEEVGRYDPLQNPSKVTLDRERALHWLKVGANPTETVRRLLEKDGVWAEYESTLPAKKPRRKPVKPRVKTPKPVKEKKRKAPPPPVEAEAGETTEAAATVEE